MNGVLFKNRGLKMKFFPKLAFVTSQYPAPSHTFVRREVDELRRKGLEVHTFSVRPPTTAQCKSAEDKAAFDTTTYLMPLKPARYVCEHVHALVGNPIAYFKALCLAMQHRVPGIKALVWAFAYFLEAMVLAQELKRRGVQHVHNHFANPSATVSLIATRYLGIGYSFTVHGHSCTDYPAGELLADKIRMADAVFCISHFGRAQCYRIVEPTYWEKIHIYRCGLDLSSLPLPVPHVAGRPYRFISVARMAPEKGHSGLITAFARVQNSAPCELVLIGDGPERSRIERQIKELGLSNIKILGALPESETLAQIAQADALVLASFMEGLPVVLMEGMALGKATIAPHLAGIPDLVVHGVNGLMFDAAEWFSLETQLRYLLLHPAQGMEMGANGRISIEAQHDIRTAVLPMLEQLTRLYYK